MNVLCSCTRVSPLPATFFCGPCSKVCCSHPQCTTERADYLLCPRCLRRWGEREGHTQLLGHCPYCPAPPSPLPTDQWHLESEGANGSKENVGVGRGLAPLVLALQGSLVLKCGVGKQSVVSHVQGRHKRPLPGGAQASGVQRSDPIPPSLACHTVGGAGDEGRSTGQAAAAVAGGGRAGISAARAGGGPRLLPLLTRRCRSCVVESRPGILLSPSIPTPAAALGGEEGPTTLKLYRKNAAASLLLPTLTLVQPKEGDLPSLGTFTLHLSNPTEHPMGVIVGGVGVFEGREGEGRGEIGVMLGPRDELEGVGEEDEEEEDAEEVEGGGRVGSGVKAGVAAFPWPQGHPLIPTPFLVTAGVKVVKNKAQWGGIKREGGPLRLRVTVFLHPKAVEEWNGVSGGSSAKVLTLHALL